MNSGPTSTSANSSTSTSLTSPTTRRNILQQTSWYFVQKQEHVKVLRLNVSEHIFKNFEKNVHNLQQTVETSESSMGRYNKTPTTSNAQQVLQDATTTAARRAGELFGYLIMHATKPGSEPNNLLRQLQRTNIGWEMFRQLRHQYVAGARVQQYTLLQQIVQPQSRWTDTSQQQQQQFQKWIQNISAYEMTHPVIDDALKVNTAINNLHGPIQQHLLLQVRPHHTWQEVRQMIDNFFANNYMHLPGQTIGNIEQDINIVRKKGKGKKGKGKGKKGRGKGYNNNYYNYNYNHYNTYHKQSQPQKGKAKGKGPIGSSDNNNTGKDKEHQGRQEQQQRKGKICLVYLDIEVLGLRQAWTLSCLMLVQQPEEHQQRSATTATSTTAISASGLIRSAHRLHASSGHRYIQLPADTSATTTSSASVSASTTGTTLYLSIICDKGVHTRTSHLRHQFHQQHVQLWRRTTTRHRRTSSPLRHQPAESRTSSRSTSRVTSSLGHPL